MTAVHYPAIIERAGGGFSVFFPDLPGCTSAGDTVRSAAASAEESLSGHLATMIDHGDEVPEPTALDRVECGPEVDGVIVVLLRADLPGAPPRR